MSDSMSYAAIRRRISAKAYNGNWYLRKYDDRIILELHDDVGTGNTEVKEISSAPITSEGYNFIATQIMLLFG